MNKGCSLTRYEQLIGSRQEIMTDIASGRNVYFSIFDGDDMIHQDYCLLMLATALEFDADIVGIEQFAVKCEEKDFSIINTLQSKDITNTTLKLKHTEDSTCEFCTNLFKASCIYNDVFNFDFSEHVSGIFGEVWNKNIDFCTLDPLVYSDLFTSTIILFNKYCLSAGNLLRVDNVSNIGDKFIPMYFYMQHQNSLEHSSLKSLLRDIDNYQQDILKRLITTKKV